VIAGLVALTDLGDDRRLLADRLDPALTSSLRLSAALLNEETGVRGYALGRDPGFLEPYRRGRREEEGALADLERELRGQDPQLQAVTEDARASAATWRREFAEPAIRSVRAGRRLSVRASAGQALFDHVRTRLDRLDHTLQVRRDRARVQLDQAAKRVTVIFVVFGGLLLVTVLMAAGVLRTVVVAPLGRLAERVRAVARGDFARKVEGDGAWEVVTLAGDVDAMRTRIVTELDTLAATRDDLERSNAELEQFAYVASHDLQEPLRKVASFTQMLARRYEGKLDERADQYIGFAVDGAKRMQELINDLLAFSRVGRLSTEAAAEVDTADLVARAETTLAARLEESGGRVVVEGELPVVRGEAGLLALVFVNLIGNGLKFRGPEPPLVRVSAHRDGDFWRFTVADNGIGIEAEYADRIFIIFQRLHPRTSYEGTGIGLAMCRKVIEYHGGRIWLDTAAGGGAVFHFTLPVAAPAAPGGATPETHPEEASTP
jgi:signal transduction histidine kinase